MVKTETDSEQTVEYSKKNYEKRINVQCVKNLEYKVVERKVFWIYSMLFCWTFNYVFSALRISEKVFECCYRDADQVMRITFGT